jgi:hypothetical protein
VKVAAAGGFNFTEDEACFTLCSVIYGTEEDADNARVELVNEADDRCGGRGKLYYDLYTTVNGTRKAEILSGFLVINGEE